ncbi:hypothetical protein GOB57_08680 [Sinorhizobium meliloti]|nr:hypothetical protein [Sinorhizobium meliloti]
MPHEEAIADLIRSESPIEWAFENLTHIDSGTAAAVFEHPSDPQLVLRLSDYPDGWFKFADDTMRMGEEGGGADPFRPVVHWIGDLGGVLVAVTERLERIEDGSTLAGVVEAALRALAGDEREWPFVERHAPGFRAFCCGLDDRLDLKSTNFLRRGETLVFNDPYSAIPHTMESTLRGSYRFSLPSTPPSGLPMP